MMDDTPEKPALVQAWMPLLDSFADMVDRHIRAALAPIEARVDELERQVAELTSQLDGTEKPSTHKRTWHEP